MSHWLFFITFNCEFCLGGNRSGWQTVAPTVDGICDLSYVEQMGGARVLWVLVCSDAEQALALLLKSALRMSFGPGYIVDQIHSIRRSLTNLPGLPCVSETKVQTL